MAENMEQEISIQMEIISKFLLKVHPSLMASGQNRDGHACVEIRPLSRETNESGKRVYNSTLSRSLQLWQLDDKGKGYLKKFLEEHYHRGYCLYYSIYSFDYDKETYTKAGKPSQKGKINSNNARYTNEFAADFDHASEEEVIKYKELLKSVGIEALWVKSGHGYHAHILLNEKLWDKNFLYRMVYLFRSRGFKCDTACVDPARILRLPGTRNYKNFTGFPAEHPEDYPMCEIDTDCDRRYTISEVIDAVSQLPVESPDDLKIYDKTAEKIDTEAPSLLADKKTSSKEASSGDSEIKISDESFPYPELDKTSLPDPVIKMLTKAEEGYRNNVEGVLIRFFKTIGLSRTNIYKILKRWAALACEPPYDIDEDFNRLYNMGGINYTGELAAIYGYLDFASVKDISAVQIPGSFILQLPALSASAARMFVACKILEHDKANHDLKEILDALGISHLPTGRATLKELINAKLVYKTKEGTAKKKGGSYLYATNKILPLSSGKLKLSYNDLLAYIADLTGSELKIYLYLKYKCAQLGRTFMSQKTISDSIGLTEQATRMLIHSLAEKKYVVIDKIQLTDYLYHCDYTLKR